MPPKRSRSTSAAARSIGSVALMNAKARELGLENTTFRNPHGLDETGHLSSAEDATRLVRYALGIPFIRDALDRSSVELPGGRELETTDELLGSWPPLVGGKTGHTADAGWSQAAAARARGVTVYGTVLGSDSRAGAERRARGASLVRPRPVSPGRRDRRDARLRRGRDRLRPSVRSARRSALPGQAGIRAAGARGARRRTRRRRAAGATRPATWPRRDLRRKPPRGIVQARCGHCCLRAGFPREGGLVRGDAPRRMCGVSSRDRHRHRQRRSRPHPHGSGVPDRLPPPLERGDDASPAARESTSPERSRLSRCRSSRPVSPAGERERVSSRS